jgi:hypothetical protein
MKHINGKVILFPAAIAMIACWALFFALIPNTSASTPIILTVMIFLPALALSKR